MNLLTAQIVFLAIMTIGVCVWCHSLVRALQLGQSDDDVKDPSTVLPEVSVSQADRIVGSCLVRGDQETVSRAIAKALLQHGTTFEVTERTVDRVVANRTLSAHRDPNATQCDGLGFALRPAGEGAVEIVYYVDFSDRRRRLRKAIFGIIFCLGLPLLLAVGLCIWLFVVPSETPGVRWQVFQTLQVSHALWPPFMLIHRYRAAVANGQAFVTNLMTSVGLADGVEAVPV